MHATWLSPFLFALLLSALGCKEGPKTGDSHSPPSIDRVSDLIHEFQMADSPNILVVAHRGDWRHAPENSIPAIQNCIDMGVDMVEIDVHRTRDGHLVLMHDGMVDRTTNGKGPVSEWTLDSLKTLYLKDAEGGLTTHRIPTLEEAMRTAKGKILVNLDKCYAYFDQAYAVLEKTGTVNHVIMKGSVPEAQLRSEFGNYLDQIIFMPVVNLGEAQAPEVLRTYRRGLRPEAYELIFDRTDFPVLDSLQEFRREGSRVWVNALWKSLNGGYDDDTALQHPDSIYGWYIDQGVGIIQTDRPRLLLDFLRKKGRHH